MDPKNQEHLDKLVVSFEDQVRQKYFKGQVEHGGNIWNKTGVLDMAMDEVLDLWVYLFTLKGQLENRKDPQDDQEN